MDLRKLIEPYGEDGRTVEGQIKWLCGPKQIPKEFADKAILSIYAELEKGMTYESGHDLDQALYAAAKKHQQDALTESVNQLEAFFNNLKTPKSTRWKYLKAVFTGKVE
jgi:hypothetical protein